MKIRLALVAALLALLVAVSTPQAQSRLWEFGKTIITDTSSTALDVAGGINAGTDNRQIVSSGGYLDGTSVQSATLGFAAWATNSCTSGQIPKYNGSAWACASDDSGAGGTITGSGTSGTLAKWTSTSGIGNSRITDSSTQTDVGSNFRIDNNGDLSDPSGTTMNVNDNWRINGALELNGITAPSVSSAGEVRLYFDNLKLKISESGGAYRNMVASAMHLVFNVVTVTWTNQPAAGTEFLGDTSRRIIADLSGSLETRLCGNIPTAGYGANGADLRLQYDAGGSGWQYAGSGSGPIWDIDSPNDGDVSCSSWVSLVSGAKSSSAKLRLIGAGGNSTMDPQFGIVYAEFR